MTYAYEDPAVLARVAAVLNAGRPPATNEGPSDRAPGLVLSRKANPGPEVERAA